MAAEHVTRFIFNKDSVLEIFSEDGLVMISISDDRDPEGKNVIVKADEIDLIISALNFYKNRIND